VEENLMHASREALSNALHHARASRIVAGLSYRRDAVAVWVEDDGRGFRPSEAARSSGLGLAILRERAQRIGARLEVRSRPGEGTRVAVTFPTRVRRKAAP
jgi:signal transduction histidine kinase